jgi:hypothetical protein
VSRRKALAVGRFLYSLKQVWVPFVSARSSRWDAS